MEEEVKQQIQAKLDRGIHHRHLFILEQDQWEYYNMLARAANFKPLPPAMRSLYEEVSRQRRIHPENYRMLNYRMVSDTQWELIEWGINEGSSGVSSVHKSKSFFNIEAEE